MANMPKKDELLKSVDNMREEASDRAAYVADKAQSAVDAVQQRASELQDTVARGATRAAETVSRAADGVSSRLRSAGVDTDVMVEAAKGKASELQQLIVDEVKSRPLRALGVAAALGLVVGLLSSR